MNRPGPALTLSDGLFISPFGRHIAENFKQFGNRLQNFRIKICIKNLSSFQNNSFSCKASFFAIFSFISALNSGTPEYFQNRIISHENTSQDLTESVYFHSKKKTFL